MMKKQRAIFQGAKGKEQKPAFACGYDG